MLEARTSFTVTALSHVFRSFVVMSGVLQPVSQIKNLRRTRVSGKERARASERARNREREKGEQVLQSDEKREREEGENARPSAARVIKDLMAVVPQLNLPSRRMVLVISFFELMIGCIQLALGGLQVHFCV